MPEQPPTFEDFRDAALERAEAAGENLPPEHDWLPILLIDAPAGFCLLPLVDPDTGDRSLMEQEGLPTIIAALIEMNANIVARIQMAWTLDPAQAKDGPLPREHPDRKEILMVQVCEAGRQELWVTDIDRSGEHPEIVKWEKSAARAGPFSDALQLAMNQAGHDN